MGRAALDDGRYFFGFFANSYVDATTGSTVYPNVSATPSNVVAFIVP